MGRGRPQSGPAGAGETFAEKLRSLREAAGLTQEELALRASLSPSAVGVLERGVRRRPYPHTVRTLAEALGLSEEERASLLATVPKLGETAQSAEVVSTALSELPHPATPLVGREREVEEASNLLTEQDVRLLTLTGTGGVGKTRLATEVARKAGTTFPGGVAFVGLAPLGDPVLVLPTIARTLGLRESDDRSTEEVLINHLRAKSLLLVLDNFEHLLGAAPRVAELIEACPDLAVLATSRAPLRVRGEQEYPIQPLPLPSSTRSSEREVLETPSGRLFVERARASSPSFALSPENAEAVAAVCWRVAGLPLALELAAAKARFLEPTALLARLDQALSTAWARDLPERQRTMRATMAWSEDLLGEKECALFRRLSVFAGGFTLESAEAIGAAGSVGRDDILGLIGDLVEQSLVVAVSGQQEGRYKMLEPVRQYAGEKLEESGEAIATRERHAEHFLAVAEAARGFLLGPEHEVWSGRLEQEHDNLREALRWARDAGDVCEGLRIAAALSWFWWMQGYLDEGRRWTEGFLSKPLADERERCRFARAEAFYGAAELAFGQGDLDRASGLFEESLALYRRLEDRGVGVAAVLAELGQVVRAQGDHDRAAALSREALDLARSLSNPRIAAIALSTLGRVEHHRRSAQDAIARYEESLTLFREVGHRWGNAYVLANLAVATFDSGDLERALALNEESLSIYADLGDKSGMALVLINLGDVAREQGDEKRATARYGEALTLYRELGNERGTARALDRLPGATEGP
jgi:predicted ATPase/DNA-binding XRE family transcriptional regulator